MSLQSYEYGLSPHDGFKVYRQFQFNHNHLEILNRLYMPLIGAQAIGTYHFMNQFVNSDDTLTHYTIMNELKMNLSEFRQYMDLLEAIGLFKTYVKHDERQSFFYLRIDTTTNCLSIFLMILCYQFIYITKSINNVLKA